MKTFAAILTLVALSSAAQYSVSIDKDAGLVYTNTKCGKNYCIDSNFNGLHTYTAFNGNEHFLRILMSFNFPSGIKNASDIEECVLALPKPVTKSPNTHYYNLFVRKLDADFSASNVTARNAPKAGEVINQTTGDNKNAPPRINITAACKAAANRKLGLVIDASGTPVTIKSKAGGSDTRLYIRTK
ncbi:hypothetical protein GGF37_006366 [Kickxella alabastrina]|nr:hypothetical protein GGF37_006366 [Kickxella alabastrina]